MLTRYVLHIGDVEYPLQDDDLSNWGDVLYTFRRSNYDGVVRSCSSEFVFVNEAREIILKAYLKDRFNAEASISILVLDDRWRYHEVFRCPLNFSTISWDAHTLKINCVDNSLEAIIKANKSTKYEFAIGSEISRDGILAFNRIPMQESLTYQLTQGDEFDDSADIVVYFDRGVLPFIGNTANEIAIAGIMNWNDDQDPDGEPYLFEVTEDIVVDLDYDLEWCTYIRSFGSVTLGVHIDRHGTIVNPSNGGTIARVNNIEITNRNADDSIPSYPDEASMPKMPTGSQSCFATVDGIVYEWKYRDGQYGYCWVSTGKTVYDHFRDSRRGTVRLNLRAGDKVFIDAELTPDHPQVNIRFIRSNFVFKWLGVGRRVDIDVFKPDSIALALLRKMITDDSEVFVEISDYDPRIAGTYLMAAESARGITGAKFYSSFNEFAEWMSAVFGYVYEIIDGVEVHFLHRSELFDKYADINHIELCTNVEYSVDTSVIYSSVTAGYDKKEYGSINGRDEFNFSNTYTTGCSVSDKKLSLISKYRADSYGIEFAVQKRGNDTTDNQSDQDVFFVKCVKVNGMLIPDRSIKINGTLTDSVFNGDFSPMACIRANAGLIGLQADRLELTFASSTGNSEITIGGESMTEDMVVDTPIATCGVVEFTTDEVEPLGEMHELITVTDSDGITYSGYIKEVDVRYAKEEAVRYKLIVKDIKI